MSQATEMRILLADNAAGTTNPISLAAIDCDLLGTPTFGEDVGKRGTRQEYDCGARVLQEIVSGGFNIRPTVEEFDWLLERALGDSISSFPGTALTPKETLVPYYAFVDKGPANYLYHKICPSVLTISASEGQYVNVRQEYVGQREEGNVSWPGSPPAVNCGSQYICADIAFELASTEYPFKSLELVLDNRIADGQQENSLYRNNFESQTLKVMLNMTFATRSDTIALYRRAVAGDAGKITMSNGVHRYVFDLANVKIPGNGPTVPAEGEITMSLNMMCKRTTANPVITVTKTTL